MTFSKHELETILYSLEGYIQVNDDMVLTDELVDICYKIEAQLVTTKEDKQMNNLILTNEQLEFLKLLLLTYEYSDNEKQLVDELEFKMYQLQEDYYKNKLTTIGA